MAEKISTGLSVALIVLVIVAAGCALWQLSLRQTKTPAPRATVTPSPITLPVSGNDPRTWKEYVNEELGIRFSYPEYGRPTRVTIEEVENTVYADIEFLVDRESCQGQSAGCREEPYYWSEVTLAFVPNADKSSVRDWFAKNWDDSRGSLLSSGAFAEVALADTRTGIRSTDRPIPDDYLDERGAVEVDVLTASTSGETIINGALSEEQVHPIVPAVLAQIVETVEAP